VCVRAIIDGNHDDDDDTETGTYYGQIEEIWELDYVGLKVALFRCRWDTNGKRAVSKGKYGYVSVDLRVFGYENEPFVFANDVEQVFYVPDLAKKNWYVVMPEKRIVGIENVVEEENTTSLTKFYHLTLHTSPNYWELTKHRTCEVTIMKSPYTEIKEEKASLIFTESFFNARGCVYWRKWYLFCNIKDEMY
jgi:hypothetical protein